MKKEIPASGSFKNYNLNQILAYLNKQQKKGILTVTDKNVRKNIYIEDGYIIFASSNKEEDRLGTLLVKEGKITPEQCDKSLKLSKEIGKRQGLTLVELGYLAPKDLFNELKHQMKEMVLGLFMREEGMFSFEENHSFPEIVKIKINIDSIIREGLIRKEMKKREQDRLYIQKVNELHENIHDINHYDLLGINIKASFEEIKKAYLKMAKTYHPDSHYNVSGDIKDKLTTILSYINKAFQTLSEKTQREEYNAHLLKKVSKKTPSDEGIKAEEHFKRGIGEYNGGNFWGASDFFRLATRMVPQKATYWAYLSLALSRMPRRIKEAEETILRAIELEPHNANYYVHLGMIYLHSGLKKRAEHQFQTALKWDPTNEKARREREKLKGGK